MQKQILQPDYTKYPRNYQLKINSEYEVLIPAEESVRLLSEVMEDLDYTNLYRAYAQVGPKPRTSPTVMYKVLVYGAMEGKYTSSEVARACRRDVNYMWLLRDEPAPVEAASRIEQLRTEPFVKGRGKRKTQLQRDTEQLAEMLTRQKKYEEYNETFRGRNSFSKTDTDATFMRMKDDHMRNAQLKPGYNVQLGVEGEYITGVDISSERSDQRALIPLLTRMEANGAKYVDVTCDAGYESEENYTYFEGKEQDCYIKPQNYEKSKTRKFKNDMNLRENMAYDSVKDEYTCQNGKKLRAMYTGKRQSKSGFESEVTFYECEDCGGCPYKKSCTRAKGNRKMRVSKEFLRQRRDSLARITSPEGILLRTNRSIQVEGAFGVIKQDYGFRQFLLRGIKKVRTEILLVAMGYNVNKLHHKIQSNRTGKQLFEKLTA